MSGPQKAFKADPSCSTVWCRMLETMDGDVCLRRFESEAKIWCCDWRPPPGDNLFTGRGARPWDAVEDAIEQYDQLKVAREL